MPIVGFSFLQIFTVQGFQGTLSLSPGTKKFHCTAVPLSWDRGQNVDFFFSFFLLSSVLTRDGTRKAFKVPDRLLPDFDRKIVIVPSCVQAILACLVPWQDFEFVLLSLCPKKLHCPIPSETFCPERKRQWSKETFSSQDKRTTQHPIPDCPQTSWDTPKNLIMYEVCKKFRYRRIASINAGYKLINLVLGCVYRTRAIISRGLYIFLPNFHFSCGLCYSHNFIRNVERLFR